MTDNNDFNNNDFGSDFSDGEFDDDGFRESGGFKEAWANSPLLKILTLAAGVIVIIGIIFMFSGDEELVESRVRGAAVVTEAPGGIVDEQYDEALQVADNQRFDGAVETGGSVLPTPRGALKDRVGENADDLDAAGADEDPLARWRRRAEERERERQTQQQQQQQQGFVQQQQQQQEAQSTVNSEQIDKLANAMAAQMQSIFEGRAISGSETITVTSAESVAAERFEETRDDISDGFDEDGDGVETIIIPAGEIFYGQIVTQASSDIDGPVLARIFSGPMRGAKILGSFQRAEQNALILSFDTMVIDGIDYQIDAVAVDPKTTSPGIVTDVNYHLFKRVILPGAAAFIEGIASAFAERENSVTVTGDVIVEEQEDLNTGGKIATGIEESARVVGEVLEDEADRVEEPTVIVAAGTAVGILFVEPLTD